MKNTYLIQIEVDEKWLDALAKFTEDVYDGEVCTWHGIETLDGDEEDMLESTEEEV